MNLLETLRTELLRATTPTHERKGTFFKTGPGEYAEHDQFIGTLINVIEKGENGH